MTLFLDTDDFRLYLGDVRTELAELADGTVDCIVTSPPYFGLRDYGTGAWEDGDPGCDHVRLIQNAQVEERPRGTDGAFRNTGTPLPVRYATVCGKCGATRIDRQVGLEASPAEYVAGMVEIFRELRRVLASHGTCWLNLGDSYANDTKWGGSTGGRHAGDLHGDTGVGRGKRATGLKQKDLTGIPWRVALALQDDGWHLRSDVIEEVELYCPCGCGFTLEERIWRWSPDREIAWAKRNCMPESVTDRPTKSHEHIFMLTKSPRYFFNQDAVREPHAGRSSGNLTRKHGEDVRAPGERANSFGRANDLGRSIPWTPISEPDPDVLTLGDLPPETPRGPDGRRATGITGRNGSIQHRDGERWPNAAGRNIRSVWTIATTPFPGAHFATFPEELVERCILAGCPEQVCSICGTPRRRTAIGWTICGCMPDGTELFARDALELVETPLGTEESQDPTMAVGRAGMSRPRNPDEGTRPITRHEQRGYAAQLKASPRRADMEADAGPAFAHYIRTDTAGARPIPPGLLEGWLTRGYLTEILPPDVDAADWPGKWRPGIVLDPFMGSGTTALVARRHGRHAIGIELSAEYAAMAADRNAQMTIFTA